MLDFSILNPEQRAAAMAPDGPLLVLAAAGTGKTQTLVYRVAHIVSSGVPASSILLLTFTNKAASEMLERAKSVAGDVVGNIWSGTFHHVCARFLRQNAGLLGFPNNFRIADRDDTRKIIDDCIKELGINAKDFPKKEVLNSFFSQAANTETDLEVILNRKTVEIAIDPAAIIRVHDRYEEIKKRDGIMDFDDLLVNALKLLREHKSAREHYQNTFKHILVDEYQDTNTLQSQMVDILAEKHHNVTAVGDDFQCIYSWRGADFRQIMSFSDRYPNAKIIKLERNYRSTPEILDVANVSISANPEQYQKTLRATRPHGVKPRVVFLRDGDDQANAALTLIRSARSRGKALSEIAVLYRSHYHSIELQMALARARIPFTITSGTGVFEQAHTKDLLSLLRIATDPDDRLAFERLIQLFPSVGAKSASSLWQKLGGSFNPATLCKFLKPAVCELWAPIAKAIVVFHSRQKANEPDALRELVEKFCESFYSDYLMKTYDNGNERLEDINEVTNLILQRESLAAFLEDVALLTNADTADSPGGDSFGGEKLRLATVHQAKGLEWPVVIVLWMCEDLFPSARSVRETDGESEERRLFYVATTRARDNLTYLIPQWQRNGRDVRPVKPSRFITEINPSYFRVQQGLY